MTSGQVQVPLLQRLGPAAAGVIASAVLVALYVQGGAFCVLGFVLLVPWLRALDRTTGVAGTLLSAWAMSVAFTGAALPWFGAAIGRFAQIGEAAGLALLLLVAPLLQPQFIAFALVRRLALRSHGGLVAAFAGSAAWVACEAFVPKALGDTLGIGLHPSSLLRQAADLGGVAGLTLLLLLANEAIAAALRRRADGLRPIALPLVLAAAVPLGLVGYGALRLATLPIEAGPTLRMGLVQSNIVDYERLRREKGAGAVVREVLDTHYAMSYDAVERQKAQAMLWSETVYPTTFDSPKSEAGAELDREIRSIVDAAGVPFVFGTYERDADGEYNAAAFVAPGRGLVGFYRKTLLFPLTEAVPAWLDGPALRSALPWLGSWLPGDGARVLPLLLADGREVPVLPLICRDAVDTGLAAAGARLGARAIVAMSNDSWFTERPLGAELHLATAAMRSVETRLPQFRVTSNGRSAVIDARGDVLAGAGMGQRMLVVGDLPVGTPPRTLVVAWGDWVGGVAALALLALAVHGAFDAWRRRHRAARPEGTAARPAASAASAVSARTALPCDVAVLPPWARLVAGGLRALARLGLLVVAAAVVTDSGWWPTNPLAQIRAFVAWILAPEAAAWLLLRAYSARLAIDGGALRLERAGAGLAVALADIVAVRGWRLPLPAPGVTLQRASGVHASLHLAGVDADALGAALAAAGAGARVAQPAWASRYARARQDARRGRLDGPLAKFVLLPFVLALPAFRLHQHIAYGSTFGELQTYGLGAYLLGFALWWAGWAIGVVLCAAVLRAAIEVLTLAAVMLRPDGAGALRIVLERAGLALLYLGLPAWLLMRALGG